MLTTLAFPYLTARRHRGAKNCDEMWKQTCEDYKKFVIFELKFFGFIIFFPFILIYGIVKLFIHCCKKEEKEKK